MKTSKSDFRHESIQDNDSIKTILEAITAGIEKKEITFSDEEDTIVMHPQGMLNLKVSASQDGNDNRISIRIKWQTESNKKQKKAELIVK